MKETEHYHLKKPEDTDFVRVSDLNGNADAIDAELHELATEVTPIARGGTGVTTAQAERKRLGLGDTTGAVPVANGGTGATTAAAARTNLGVTAANVVGNQAITPSSVTATGEVKGSTVSDSVGSLADLRDSVSHAIILTQDDSGVAAWKTSGGTVIAFILDKQARSLSVAILLDGEWLGRKLLASW